MDRKIAYWISKARKIAVLAHLNQFRHDGVTPYIVHPSRVAAQVENRLKPIAWLHDVVEDSMVDLLSLLDAGFPPYIIEAVDAITHRKGESYENYLKRVKANPDATEVKRKDVLDNFLDSPTFRQKEKYAKALDILC